MKKLLITCLLFAGISVGCTRGVVVMRVSDQGDILIDEVTKTDLFIFGTDSTKRNTGVRLILSNSDIHGRPYEYSKFYPLNFKSDTIYVPYYPCVLDTSLRIINNNHWYIDGKKRFNE